MNNMEIVELKTILERIEDNLRNKETEKYLVKAVFRPQN